jgi:hypothetical protein
MRNAMFPVFPGLILVALVTIAACAASPAVRADQPSTQPSDLQALRDEVAQLRSQVHELQQESQTETAHRVQVDADRHSQMMDLGGVSAGWTADRGFYLKSEDGNFVLSPFVLFQLRDATVWRQDAKAGKTDDTENGFEVRRLQLGFDGNVFSPDLTYRIFWQSSEITTGNLSLLMAWIQYRIHDTPYVIGGGQFKSPFDHEQWIGDAKQLAADRTYVDDTLAGGEGFTKGLTIRYDDGGRFRAEGALTQGFNNNNSTFQDFPTNEDNFGIGARAEYKFFGRWQDYEHFSSLGNTKDLLVAGGGLDLSEAGHTNVLRHVIDCQYNPGPIGLYAAYLGRYIKGNTEGPGGDTYDPSLRLQASYLFNPHWEGFGRYDYVHLDEREFKTPTSSGVSEFTLGANYYIYGQNAKLTLDLSYLPKGTPTTDTGNDLIENPGHADLLFRTQFQLLL